MKKHEGETKADDLFNTDMPVPDKKEQNDIDVESLNLK